MEKKITCRKDFKQKKYKRGVLLFYLIILFVVSMNSQNIALNGVATQSSTLSNANCPGNSCTANLAIDSNTSGVFSDGSISTTNQEVNPWWLLNLQKLKSIGQVTIWNRTDCCTTNLDNFILEILDDTSQVVYSYTHVGSAGVNTIISSIKTKGQYVRIRLVGSNRTLNLSEVEVFEDTDLDGIANFEDLDDDNDGITDLVECTLTSANAINRSSGFEFSDLTNKSTIASPMGDYKVFAAFNGWTNLGSIDWSSGQYVRKSSGLSHAASGTDGVGVLPSSVDGGGFVTFSVANEGIQTDVAVEVGKTYTVSFNIGVLPLYENTAKFQPDVEFSAVGSGANFVFDETDLQAFSNTAADYPSITTVVNATPSNPLVLDPNWELFEQTFTATSTGNVRLFFKTNNTEAVWYLDAVRIVEGTSATYLCLDTDGDGIDNYLDLDSDGDGCPDAVESNVSGDLLSGDVINGDGISNTTNNISNAVAKGPYGNNGLANPIESNDTNTAITTYNSSYSPNALDITKGSCGIPMITQVYHSSTDKWIEVTNIDDSYSVPKNSIFIALYKDTSGEQTNKTPNAFISNSSEILPGESFLIKSSSSVITNILGTSETDNLVTDFNNENDIIVVSKTSNNQTWNNRVDVIESIKNNTSYVRIDEVIEASTVFTMDEWVAFIDDNIITYGDISDDAPIERHPHDPLLSEIANANSEANIRLGLHRVNLTERITNSWSNGYPDRSRRVRVSENYNHTQKLSAREFEVFNNSIFSITDNALVVTDVINVSGTNSEIRLVSTTNTNKSQLIQTHTEDTKYTGQGKLLVDQNSTIPSTYRYNYLSSPVNNLLDAASVISTEFKVEDVLKDGTTPLNTSGEINIDIAKDINFIGGYDGSPSSPISIADYWIYTYASGDGTRSNWQHKYSTGLIPQTDGFIMKGPGVAQNYTFVGSAKDGNLTTNIGADQSYLIGNPYPSALNAKKFIEDNINSIDGTLYFWEHHLGNLGESDIQGHYFQGYIGGYSTRNISMGIAANNVASNENNGTAGVGEGSYKTPGSYIPIAQGFFVSGDLDGGQIVFNNSQREYVTEGTESVFFKNDKVVLQPKEKNKLPIIKLGMNYLNDDGILMHRQIGISFKDGNSFNFDKGYDSKLYDLGTTDFYWKFKDNESKYSIAGVQRFSRGLNIPFDILMANDGKVTLMIDEWESINKHIYIKDKVRGKAYRIDKTKAVLNLKKGLHTDRFELSFSKKNTNNEDEAENIPFTLFYNTSNKSIVISKKGKVKITSVALYKINSRKVQQWRVKNQNKKITLKVSKRVKKGFYVVKIITSKGVYNKKIFLK